MIIVLLPGCASVEDKIPERSIEAGKLWPMPPMESRIRYIRSISSPADIAAQKKPGLFAKALRFLTGGERTGGHSIARPYGIYFDSKKGELYVADTGLKGIHKYDLASGKSGFLDRAGETYFEMPVGVVVVNKKIYITDTVLKKLFITDLDGDLIREIEGWSRPGGIAYDALNGRIYVVDVLEGTVKALDLEGNYLFEFGQKGGKSGELHLPSNVWADRKGNVYVSDSMNFRIQVFDSRGYQLASISQLGDGSGDLARPKGVAVDSDGNIYVVDSNFNNVQIFDIKGRLLLFFGESGSRKPGQFNLPTGIFIDGSNRVYVADAYNARIQVFQYLESNEGSDITSGAPGLAR
ncbi:MAG: SBBP repeat-containing protein [Proteobacteria bacterium]|nr:SBBP repeat-containing protein [Pseudomonadota bacterium]